MRKIGYLLRQARNFRRPPPLDIRPWQPGDETAILDLFQTTFGSRMSLDFWKWRYLDHPAGGPLIMLAWDGDRLAAHYAASRAPLVVNGETRPAALSMTTMTHADYRGQGLFEQTASALYGQMADEGLFAVWGFPNRNSNPSFRRKLGWDAIADISVMSRDLRDGETFPDSSLTEVSHIDSRFDTVRPPTVGLRGAHGSRLLSWRIDRNPANRYLKLVLPSGDGLDGYAILKSYKETEFDLVLLAATDAKAYPDLIAGCLSAVQARGGKRLNCWCLPQDEARLPLERQGFQAVSPVTYFGGRVLTGEGPAFDDVRGWRISMIDSDIY